jgi:hypothetical protein
MACRREKAGICARIGDGGREAEGEGSGVGVSGDMFVYGEFSIWDAKNIERRYYACISSRQVL